jgi:hypothetical protein
MDSGIWILATVARFYFMSLVIFSYEPNVEKYFQKNHFFFLKNDFVENIL